MQLSQISVVVKLLKTVQKIAHFRPTSRLIHRKIKTNMDEPRTAYFHLLDGAEKFKVNFKYSNETVGVNRQFNFERSAVETVQAFLNRVTTNLEKYVMPKLKKKRKKMEDSSEDEPDFKVIVELIANENSVPDSAICKDIFFSNKYHPGSLKLRMIGLNYTIAINSPWIDSLSLPKSMMVGFPVYPNSFETRFTEKHLSTFTWMKSSKLKLEVASSSEKSSKGKEESCEWTVVGDGFMYTPDISEIGYKLKVECTPKNSSGTGPPVSAESANPLEAGPGLCPFEVRHLFTQHKTPKESFRVVSYNILADVYSSTDTAQNDLFNYCPSYALSIDYRKQLFLKELLGYNADLICLQEVDTNVFENDLVPVLGEQGLIGVHAKKSTIREGVSSFYSPSKFKLLETQEVVLSQELQNKSYCSQILACVVKNDKLKERITGLGTAAQALVLESLEKPEEVLVVGNTHLYFHPDADHIRLLQGGIVMAFLTNIVDTIKKKSPGQAVSLMCCGDFNSVPTCGIYKLMTTKSVPEDFVDWKSKPEEEVKGLSLGQPFNIDSACGTPEYTNYTVSFADCLDYIYYQTDRISVENVVPLPSGDELREHRAIPSVVFPSDHVALVADLRWST